MCRLSRNSGILKLLFLFLIAKANWFQKSKTLDGSEARIVGLNLADCINACLCFPSRFFWPKMIESAVAPPPV